MPKFETVIPARGPSGNIFAILGCAKRMMRKLCVSPEDIEELSRRVMSSGSYEEACSHIREWFPLEEDK